MILPNFLSTNLNTEVEKNTQYQSNTDIIYPANRSLVILMGELRGVEPAWETLYKQVLDPNLADLALLTTNNSTHTIRTVRSRNERSMSGIMIITMIGQMHST